MKKSLKLIAVIILATVTTRTLALPSSIVADTQFWSDNVKISYECLNPSRPEICIEENNIYVVWSDYRNININTLQGDNEIYFKKSEDGGKSWSEDIRLTNTTNLPAEYWPQDVDPAIGVDENNIHIVWCKNLGGGLGASDYEIYYTCSFDKGATWNNEKQLTNSTGKDVSYPSIAVVGESVHVIWGDDRDGGYKLYYKYSKDRGGNWSEDIKLSDTGAVFTDVAVGDNNTIHIVWSGGWYNQYIRYNQIQEFKKRWVDDKLLSPGITRPRIAVDGINVHIVWFEMRETESGNAEIFYTRSTDNGENFSENIRLARSYGGHQAKVPDVATSGANVYVSWEDGRDENIEIYYKWSEDNGMSWSNDTRLTYDLDDSYDCSIEAYEKDVYAVWVDYNFAEDWTYVYFKRTVPYLGFLKENVSKPIVMVISPNSGETIEGAVWIRGVAYSTNPNSTIQKVEIKIGRGRWDIANGTTNWSYLWDTTQVEWIHEGEYTIFVRAWDGYHYSEYYKLTLYVRLYKRGSSLPIEYIILCGVALAIVSLVIGIQYVNKTKKDDVQTQRRWKRPPS